jgi:hypothetical protein
MARFTTDQLREAIQKHMHQVAIERGRKGGTTRAKNMTAAERSAAARRAVQVRWKKAKKKPAG